LTEASYTQLTTIYRDPLQVSSL